IAMRATVLYGAGDVRVENVPDARLIESTDALVTVSRACICGSDLWPYKLMKPGEPPRRMGHEAIGFDDADRLVAHAAGGLARLHQLVRPEIAAADAGAADGDERVGRLDQAGVGDVLDADVAGAVQDGCSHRDLPLRIHIVYPGFLYSFAEVSTMSGL